MKRILSLALVCVMMLSLVAVNASAEAAYAPGTVLRMATGYNSAKTGISFDAETAGEGITLADGKTYNTGALKPTWVALEEILGVKFEDKYQGNGSAKEFEFWKDRLAEVDMVSGTAATLSEYGEVGSLVNLADYMDKLPNFKAYLDANPIVRLSITGNTKTGAIYFSPYFDGVNDIERMPLMRVDWAVKLLDGEGEFTAEACKDIAAPVYTPYMPTSGKVLFCGQNAAWDVDELVALMRCVVANPFTLNGTDTIQGMFSREEANNGRRVDLYRFAGTLFGVRGMEARQDYLYVGTDGQLHDARQEKATYEALAKMHEMTEEGLISTAYVNAEDLNSSKYLEMDLGFVSYDYNQTQTVMNATKLQNDEGEKYMAIMVPVARWFDGSDENGTYMRFTESWRSVKTDGWAISKAGVEGNADKLNAALALIDYAYSEKGQILMSYGPDAFIKTKDDGSYETFLFNGKEMPVIADATKEELWAKASGNYTNYARQFLGSTLSFVKSQAFEYQCTHDIGKEGAGYISTAIGLGTIKHPELAITENGWYTSVPTVLPNTKVENDELNTYTQLTANGKFSATKGGENLFVDIIAKGFTEAGLMTPEEAAETVFGDWFGEFYLELKTTAWERVKDYYNSLGN